MKLLITLGFFLLAANRIALAEDLDACLNQVNFMTDFYGGKITHQTVNKKGCLIKLAVIQGRGEKWEVDICNPTVMLSYVKPIDNTLSETSYAGSGDCPRPLFGIDAHMDKVELFNQRRAEIMQLMKNAVEKAGTPIGTSDIASIAGQVRCVQKLLQHYLLDCENDLELTKASGPAQSLPSAK